MLRAVQHVHSAHCVESWHAQAIWRWAEMGRTWPTIWGWNIWKIDLVILHWDRAERPCRLQSRQWTSLRVCAVKALASVGESPCNGLDKFCYATTMHTVAETTYSRKYSSSGSPPSTGDNPACKYPKAAEDRVRIMSESLARCLWLETETFSF